MLDGYNIPSQMQMSMAGLAGWPHKNKLELVDNHKDLELELELEMSMS